MDEFPEFMKRANRIATAGAGTCPSAASSSANRFSRQTAGSFGSEQHYSANLGGEFMKRYRVTFDIPGSRLVIEGAMTQPGDYRSSKWAMPSRAATASME